MREELSMGRSYEIRCIARAPHEVRCIARDDVTVDSVCVLLYMPGRNDDKWRRRTEGGGEQAARRRRQGSSSNVVTNNNTVWRAVPPFEVPNGNYTVFSGIYYQSEATRYGKHVCRLDYVGG